ncbi:unnamed protein product [Ectocarpus sp. 6 AP-2014]
MIFSRKLSSLLQQPCFSPCCGYPPSTPIYTHRCERFLWPACQHALQINCNSVVKATLPPTMWSNEFSRSGKHDTLGLNLQRFGMENTTNVETNRPHQIRPHQIRHEIHGGDQEPTFPPRPTLHVLREKLVTSTL